MTTATDRREYTTHDKSEWGPGPWQDEPDKLSWVDEATGLDCLMVRNSAGTWCGYVGVGPDHPWHGVDYSACVMGADCDSDPERYSCDHRPDAVVRVHGGLTFADSCHKPTKSIGNWIDGLNDEQKDRIVRGSGWTTGSWRFGNARCLVGHAVLWSDGAGDLELWCSVQDDRHGYIPHRFDALVDRFGLDRIVRAVKARAAATMSSEVERAEGAVVTP